MSKKPYDYNDHHLKCHKMDFSIIDRTSYRGQNYHTNMLIIVHLATLVPCYLVSQLSFNVYIIPSVSVVLGQFLSFSWHFLSLVLFLFPLRSLCFVILFYFLCCPAFGSCFPFSLSSRALQSSGMDSMFVMEQTGNTESPGTASVAGMEQTGSTEGSRTASVAKTEQTGSMDSSWRASAAVTKQAGVALLAVTEQAANTGSSETALSVTLIPLHFWKFSCTNDNVVKTIAKTTKITILYMPGQLMAMTLCKETLHVCAYMHSCRLNTYYACICVNVSKNLVFVVYMETKTVSFSKTCTLKLVFKSLPFKATKVLFLCKWMATTH